MIAGCYHPDREMPPSRLLRRALYLVAGVAPIWALITYVTDGFAFSLGPLKVKATEPIRPLVIAAASTAIYAWRYSSADISAYWQRLLSLATRLAVAAIPAIVLLAAFIGIYYGSFTAGGSDSYGYVSQAALWLKGSLRVEQPWVKEFSWPGREWAFAPLGYRPLSSDGTLVPTYASGLPILMAGFQALFGSNGPFLVVPVLGAVTVWLTYVLGRQVTGSRATAAFAALLLLSSPVFLAQVMLPMTDVPVAAGWTLVAVLALREPRARALAAGLVAGATLMIRPNLLLLTLVPILTWNARPSYVIRFGLGLLPGIFMIAALNTYLFGAPLTSGYGVLGEIFGWRSAWPNVKNYGLWIGQTQTPLVALALVPLAIPSALRSDDQAKVRRCLGSILALTLVSYIFYSQFDVWMYLRFMLPAYPALFVLMAAGIRFVCQRVPSPIRAFVTLLICVVSLAASFSFAKDQYIFTSRAFEQRYIRGAEYVAQATPANAVVLSAQHSGSVRFYGHRITLRFDALDGDQLDATLNELRAKGYDPYLIVDGDWEEGVFRERFATASRAGRLDWAPLGIVKSNPEVRVYRFAGS